MSSPTHGPDDLVAEEGVDEGSADSTQEGPSSGAGAGGDLLGEPPHGAPVDDVQAAAPVDMESAESRAARDATGTGQQVQEGEG
jgi:hypothetical protein